MDAGQPPPSCSQPMCGGMGNGYFSDSIELGPQKSCQSHLEKACQSTRRKYFCGLARILNCIALFGGFIARVMFSNLSPILSLISLLLYPFPLSLSLSLSAALSIAGIGCIYARSSTRLWAMWGALAYSLRCCVSTGICCAQKKRARDSNP